ncbi:Crp/Fnr family transcriptional regulator [Klebsiella pneumoniae]|nr:Crp/Fnr family transcriptional regulator [Klebsiella pneumoniae]SVV37944.1 Crp/Fnr family transcriptional regulator [Klebsiella pneumoniae]
MNFQEIHSYYKTLAIADFFADILVEGEEVILAANKKWCPQPGYIYFCTESSLSILMPDDGLNIGNTIEHRLC